MVIFFNFKFCYLKNFQGQKSNKLLIGRAAAQPRVNVADGVYSPYSSVRIAKKDSELVNNVFIDNSKSKNINEEQQPLKVSIILL